MNSKIMRTIYVSLLGLSLGVLAGPSAALAAQGDCGQPVSSGASAVATDCLFILQASVGGASCGADPCICDVTGTGGLGATDALVCLQFAVGNSVFLNCPCGIGTTLEPAGASVSVAVTGTAVPGAAVGLEATVDLVGGCRLNAVSWTQSEGAPATLNLADTASATAVLGSVADYKAFLLKTVAEPQVTQADLPENVVLPPDSFPAGLLNRFYLVGINPFELEEAGLVSLDLEVITSCGTVSESVEIHTKIPWKTAGGIRNVPIGRPVLMHGRSHVDEDEDGFNDDTGADVTTYDWAFSAVPTGSATVLVDATSQDPEFTPDIVGIYTVTVTDTTRLPGDEVVTIDVYAGTWQGAITGENSEGRPLAAACTGCHNPAGVPAPDNFTPWMETGHAEIFTNNLNTNAHYSDACFKCHSVGYDPEVDNGGFDDAPDFEAFTNSGLIASPRDDNWSAMVTVFPAAASLANAQCENCHGPQNGSGAHRQGDPRISLSADLCAQCHGETLRHARFQQWQLSAHANYELAEDRAESGSCSRCHTANGFLTWLPILLDDDPATDPTADITVTWTADEAHPQTCATCHDPHAPGNTSGVGTNATVRISGSTPPLIGGFQARGVGRGAICMTCHNSRRGRHDDSVYPGFVGTTETSRAPHGSAQADLLMGQNAYLVNTGIRGSHSFIEDTCVNCHMVQTPPPSVFSYNQTGTNHTFFASTEICSNCHGAAFDAAGVQEAFTTTIADLQDEIESAVLQVMSDQIVAGNVIELGSGGPIVSDVATISDIELGERSGRQAITVTFIDTTVVGPTGLNSVNVRDGVVQTDCPAPLTRCELYDFADERVPKSGWNWALVTNDGSSGVHNPAFALQLLDASLDALFDLTSGN